MKRAILLTVLFVAIVRASEADLDEDEIEFESSGVEPTETYAYDPFTDDEDLGEESEGSGAPPIEPEEGEEVTFVEPTESTTTKAPEKKESNTEGKSRSVVVEGGSDSGSEEKKEKEPELEEPVSETDNAKGVSDEVKSPDGDGNDVAVASTPSIQFLAAVIVGGCIGLLFAICVIMLLVYRMRKKDEGSYALDYGLDKKPQGNYEYTKGVDKEYYA